MCDVVVVGSGAAGLSAAVADARVSVLEGSDRWGGATAVSGGHLWAPANHHMAELGVSDTPEDAPVLPGLVGTKGGLHTDTRARVLHWCGQPIPGLYAAGDAMAATIGPGIVSPGATIGSALTWGWIAGIDAAA